MSNDTRLFIVIITSILSIILMLTISDVLERNERMLLIEKGYSQELINNRILWKASDNN